jgi:hypothetical protein
MTSSICRRVGVMGVLSALLLSGCMGFNANVPVSSSGMNITLMPIVDTRTDKTYDIDTVGMIQSSVQKELSMKGYYLDVVDVNNAKQIDNVKLIIDKNHEDLAKQGPPGSKVLLYVYLKNGTSTDSAVFKFALTNLGAMIVQREPPKILWSNEEEKFFLLMGFSINNKADDHWTRAQSVARTINALLKNMPDISN